MHTRNTMFIQALTVGMVFLVVLSPVGCDKRSQREIEKAVKKAKEDAAQKAKEAAKKAVDDAVEGVKDVAKKKLDEVTRPFDQPSPDEIKEAVNWAESQIDGQKHGSEWGYYNMCQKFVAHAYNKKFASGESASAVAQALKADQNLGTPPPRGAWVFYWYSAPDKETGVLTEYGHTALSVDDDYVISARFDDNTYKTASAHRDKYNKMPGVKYRGWAWPKRKGGMGQ